LHAFKQSARPVSDLRVPVPEEIVVSPEARFNLAFDFIQESDGIIISSEIEILFAILTHGDYKLLVQDVTRTTNLFGFLVHELKEKRFSGYSQIITLCFLQELLRVTTKSKVHAPAMLKAGFISHGKLLKQMLTGKSVWSSLLEALESAMSIISTVE
jgi:hypothetical protein